MKISGAVKLRGWIEGRCLFLRGGAWHMMRQRGPITLDDCDIRLSPEKCWDREIIHAYLSPTK